MRRSTRRSPPGERRSSSAAPVCTSALRSAGSTCRRRRSPARASAGSASTTSEGAEAAHALLAERDPSRGRRRAPERPPPRRARARARREPATRSRGDRLWADETRHPTLIVGLDVPADGARPADRGAHAGDVRRRGRGGGARGARASRSRRPRGRSWACARSRSCRVTRRVASSSSRTRRFAAYQRKWMRRIPGLVSVRADRSPGRGGG